MDDRKMGHHGIPGREERKMRERKIGEGTTKNTNDTKEEATAESRNG